MSNVVIDNLRSERDSARDAAIAMAEGEDFDSGNEAYLQLEERAVKLDGQIEHLTKLFEARQAADALDGKLSKAAKRSEERADEPPESRSWGATLVRSEAWQSYGGRGQSGRVTIDAPWTRALPTGLSDLVAAGLTGGKLTVDVTAPTPPTPLMDAISQIQVSSNSIEFVSWALGAGGAAVVAEKGAKPSMELTPTVVPASLENIAVWTQATRAMLDDVAGIRSLVDSELRREVAREEEEQGMTALGAATLPTATGDDLLSSIRVGMATVQSAGYSPNAVLLNPADYADLDVAVFLNGSFGPTVGQNFWGLTPIPNADQAAGTSVVGDFKAGVQRFYRSQIEVFASDSHASTFISNVITILAERRAKTVVVRPQALVEVSAGA